jgi:hypothetical protein
MMVLHLGDGTWMAHGWKRWFQVDPLQTQGKRGKNAKSADSTASTSPVEGGLDARMSVSDVHLPSGAQYHHTVRPVGGVAILRKASTARADLSLRACRSTELPSSGHTKRSRKKTMPSFRTPTQTPALQYSLAVILSVGPTIFTALRFRARIVKRTRLDWDDWLIVVALVGRTCIAVFFHDRSPC